MSLELEPTLEALLFLSPEPVPADALADATGAQLHEVVTALERLREYYEFERRGLMVRRLEDGERALDLTSLDDWEEPAPAPSADAESESEGLLR